MKLGCIKKKSLMLFSPNVNKNIKIKNETFIHSFKQFHCILHYNFTYNLLIEAQTYYYALLINIFTFYLDQCSGSVSSISFVRVVFVAVLSRGMCFIDAESPESRVLSLEVELLLLLWRLD